MRGVIARNLVRGLLPAAARTAVRQRHRVYTLSRSLRAVLDDPARAIRSSKLMEQLVYGWGNRGWSAQTEYLRRIVAAVLASRSDVIECGSGLSTLVIAAAARVSGVRVWSLEHTQIWRERVTVALRRHGLGDEVANVLSAPLRSYGDFDWYTVPPVLAGRRWGLVVCDGPPSETRGGRYGLLPVLRSQLERPGLVLLDDAARPGEQEILARWAAEDGGHFEVKGTAWPFGELVLP